MSRKATAASGGRGTFGGDFSVRVVVQIRRLYEDGFFIGARFSFACIHGDGGDQWPVLSAAGQSLERPGDEVSLVGELDDSSQAIPVIRS